MVGVISYATELRLFVFATPTSKSVPRLQGEVRGGQPYQTYLPIMVTSPPPRGGVRGGPTNAFVVIVLVLMPLCILPSSVEY